MRISLCLLTWDEAHGCRSVLPALDLSAFFEVFALDAGSTDGTIELLQEAGIKVVPQQQRSYNAAYREALEYFTGESIIFFHPKGTISTESLLPMQEFLGQGNDLVVASRMLDHSVNEEDDGFWRPRKWFGQGLALAASLRWNRSKVNRVSDPLHGYRGCSRAFADTLQLRSSGVTADLEMVAHAYKTGSRVAEYPVHESGREIGDSHFPAWKTGRRLISYLLWGS